MKSAKNNIFRSFLFSYLLVWILPITVSFVAYYKAYDAIKENAIEDSVLKLEHSSNVIDGRLAEIGNMLEQISISNNFNMLFRKDMYLYEYQRLRGELTNYRITNNFIKSIYICLKDKDIIISSDYVTDKIEMFYNSEIKPLNPGDEIYSYKDFLQKIFNGNYYHLPASNDDETIKENVDSNSDLVYITSYPLGSKTILNANIIVKIQKRELQSVVKDILLENEWLYVVDKQGREITSINASNIDKNDVLKRITKEVNSKGSIDYKKDTIISYVESPNNEWMYIAGFSKKSIMSRLTVIKYFTFWIAIIVLLVGISCAIYMSIKSSRPILALANTVKGKFESTENENIFEFLHGSIREMLKNNEELKNEIKEKIPLLKVSFMDRLIRGNFNSRKELMCAMKNAGISLTGAKFTMVIVRVKTNNCINIEEDGILNGINMAKLITSRTLEMLFGDTILIHDIGRAKLAILFSFPFDDDMQIRNAINNVSNELHKHLKEHNDLHVRFAAGLPYNSLFDVYRSFDEALQASEYTTNPNDVLLWYMKATTENQYYYYPVEVENKIINLVKTGNKEGVYALLEDLYQENIVNRDVKKNMLAYLFTEMKGTFLRILTHINFENDEEFRSSIIEKIEEIDNITLSEDKWERIKVIYTTLCDQVNKSKNQYSSQLITKIIEFVELNYTDQQLNRYMVATKFNLSEVYLSRFFKEQMGENLAKYIEQIRLKKAHELITNSNLPINDIVEKTGYSCVRTFRRAYVRIYGILPSEDRKGPNLD